MSPSARRQVQPLKVLHVEVGGSYGGSLRALEVYLAWSGRKRAHRHVLLYYPVTEAEGLRPYIESLIFLHDRAPVRFDRSRLSRVGESLRMSTPGPVMEVRRWAGLIPRLPEVRRLARLLRARRYDVVHVNNTFTYQPSTLLAARHERIPVLAHVRNPVKPGFFSRYLMRQAARVVTVNHVFERELSGWGLPVSVATCHDGLVAPVADPEAARRLRSELIGEGNLLVGSVGRLDAQKGYRDLILAARRVLDAFPSARFAVIGEGPLHADLERLIAQLGLSDRFFLCGFRQDVGNFLAALDLFVCSSLWEGQPYVVLEAMLLGKPVITTRVGITPEIIIPGRTGELVPPSNPRALADAIIQFLKAPDRTAPTADESRRTASAWCDPAASARRLDQLIEDTARRA